MSTITAARRSADLIATLLALLLAAIVHAGEAKPPAAATDPETERRSFTIAPRFEIALFASDPLIAKPIQMTFDAAGRLWVVTSSIYPHIDPSETPDDRVVVLEDVDGDGRADTAKTFAKGLFMPTGIELGDGGVYVANGETLLFLRDRDGDGVADERRVLFSGFGTGDTHHIVHGLRWSPEGDLLMTQSIYINSTVETAYGTRAMKGTGTWRLRPRDQRLEPQPRTSMVNPWGRCFNAWGDAFLTDGAGDPSIFQDIPGDNYSIIGPRTGKLAGLELLSGRHLPPGWSGRMITSDFRANRVIHATLRENGSGFAASVGDFIKSSDRAFRPVDVKMGPDGAIYIADWYNPIIQHGEVDFRDPRRDRSHGRIWRITATGRPLVERPKLVGADLPTLFARLRDPEDYTRHHARRLLQGMAPASVLPPLTAWVKALPADAADTPRSQLEALWIGQSFSQVDAGLLAIVLRSPEAGARAAGVRVIADGRESVDGALDLLAKLAADPHPRVRREVVRALARFPTLRAFQLALSTLDLPADALMQRILNQTLVTLRPVWLPALRDRDPAQLGDLRHLAFLLQASGSGEVVPALLDFLKSGAVPPARRGDLLAQIASLGKPEDLAAVFKPEAPEGDAASLVAVLNALAVSANERKVVPTGDLGRVSLLFKHAAPLVRVAALRLAGAWKVAAVQPAVADVANDATAPAEVRTAAIEALGVLGPTSFDVLLTLSAADSAPIRATAISALAGVDLKRAAQAVPTLFPRDPAAVTTAFLRREGGGAALAAVIAGLKPTPQAAQTARNAVELSGRDEPELLRVLNAAGGGAAAGADTATLARDARARGDSKRGKEIYQQRLGCAVCHAIAGTGGLVGPDLTSIGSASPIDYLIDSVMTPDKDIKDGFGTVTITTSSGAVVSGVVVRQDAKEMLIRTATGSEEVVPMKAVKSRQDGKSLMPTGLTQGLSAQEFLDLISYLAALGS